MRLFPLGVGVALGLGCSVPVLGPPRQVAEVAGVRHLEGSFPGVGGTPLFEQSWHPAERPARAVLVLVHGLKDHSTRYAEVASELALSGISVHAFDLRGHGRSEGPSVWVDRFDDYLGDLGIFLDRVRKAEPELPLFLFGHSMGGAIAALYVLTRQPYLQGLLLSGPALHVELAAPLKGTVKFLGAVWGGVPALALDPKDFSRDPAVVEDMQMDPLIHPGNGPARTAAELFHAMDRIEPLEGELRLPILLMHGGEDRITDPQGTRGLYERAGSKDKTLKIYPGLYHDLLHEPERAQVRADLLRWVLERAHY